MDQGTLRTETPEEKILRIKGYKKKYYLANRDMVIERATLWALANPERSRASQIKSRATNILSRRASRQKWKDNNKERVRIYQLAWISKTNKIKRRTDPVFKVKELCRGRLNRSLRTFAKTGTVRCLSTERLVGCAFQDLVKHIESQWQSGMNWGNHAQFGWHIDHIKPICSFDLTDPEQQKTCFHYTNLQPLWWKDNFNKKVQWERDQAAKLCTT